MKYSVFIATAAFVCASASAGDYVNGQAARMIIGQATFDNQYPGTTERLLGAAGGVAYGGDTLLIADSSRFTGLTPQNRRVLIYRNVSQKLPSAAADIGQYTSRCPVCTARPEFPYQFDVVLGQSDFKKNDPAVTQSGLRLPTAVATDGKIMAVADTENNRILIWNNIPANNNAPADIVLGQDNFTSVRLPIKVDNKSFRGPQGVWIGQGKLYVADTQNHRVMIWNTIPTQSNTPADIVLGQPNFTTASEPDLTRLNTAVKANTLLNPVSVTTDGKRLFVADLGFSRVLIWNSIPTQTQQPADVVVGQPDMETQGSNNSTKLCASNGTDSKGNATYPVRCAKTMDFPRFALSDGTRLYISDGGNDRVLVYNTIPTSNGAAADVVIGQPDFESNLLTSTDDLFAPNFTFSMSDTVPAPAQLAWDGENLYVADPTDRRVLVFTPGSPDIERGAIRNAASLRIFALSVLTFTSSPKENDELTVTIKNGDSYSKDYKYKAAKDDTIEKVINGIVAAINADSGDPYILAVANVAFNAVSFVARKPGEEGFGVTISTALSDGAQLTTSYANSNATVQNTQRIAPGTIVSIFGKNLSPVTLATPSDSQELPYELGGVQVYFDGNRAPIVSVSPEQINAQVPFEVLDTKSIAAWVRTKMPDGSVKVTTAVGIPIAQENPGVFAEGSDEPRRAVAFHFSRNGSLSIQIDGTITAGDTATVKIEDRAYTYTVVSGDTLANVRDQLIALINSNNDEKLVATPGAAFPRIVLTAKVAGEAGNGIPVTTSVKDAATIILTTSKAATCCAANGGARVTEDDPAVPGEIIVVYATGIGIVGPDAALNALTTGIAYKGPALNDPREFMSSLVGGKTANIISAGYKVGAIGISEVILELNGDLPTNPQTQLTIAQNIYTSNIVTIPVVSPDPAAAP